MHAVLMTHTKKTSDRRIYLQPEPLLSGRALDPLAVRRVSGGTTTAFSAADQAAGGLADGHSGDAGNARDKSRRSRASAPVGGAARVLLAGAEAVVHPRI